MASSAGKQSFHRLRRLLAKKWLRINSGVTVIGVTGSYGKTNTSRAIATVLSEKFPTLQTDLNLDTVYNLPITLLRLRPGHKFLVLEMGVDHPGDMSSYLDLVKPAIAVLTGISPVHSDEEHLGSLDGIISEKGKLLEALSADGWAILNGDDENVRKMASKTHAKIIWYGLNLRNKEKLDVWAKVIKVDFSGTSFTLHFGDDKIDAKIGLIGRHFIQAALVASIIGQQFGLSEEEIVRGLAKVNSLPGRLSFEKGPRGTKLLDDHLRANPASTTAGLETLADLPAEGKKIAIMGEMGELGKYSKEEHRKIGGLVAKLGIDYLVGVGPLQKFTTGEAAKKGMKNERVFWVPDVVEASKVIRKVAQKDDLLYLKGSLLRHLERILLLLDNRRVDCKLVSCHVYKQCPSCPKLVEGL
ncbi:MAG: UDP-N-acetylmuramoyl-tripeptide--D-alanyl-D-alanine ligase [bacterium]|nr:UDP-N-acetylmuramoyl-tripeptide--D-alanyl-D-alanine ligase [bacterium]